MRAADTIYQGYDDAPNSVWYRTNAAHRSGKTKSGPKIRNREYDQFHELCEAALSAPVQDAPEMPIKPSRFILVTLFRAIRNAKSELPMGDDTPGPVLLDKIKRIPDTASAGQSAPLELTYDQITGVMGTITKIIKRVRNASRVDASISADPSARYLSFMMSSLGGGYAISSETAAYKRRAEQTAAQLRQFHEPEPDTA